MKHSAKKFLSCVALALPVLMSFSITASAEYSFEIVKAPGALETQAFGLNDAGKVTGGAFDGVAEFGYVYDLKTGTFTNTNVEFTAIDINNSGVMVGSVDLACAIRDKHGNVTLFNSPSSATVCRARGVNSKGKVSGFQIDANGVWSGFVYDPKKRTFEEFLPSAQTFAHGINAQDEVAGSVTLAADEAYPGSPPGRYGYVWNKNGSLTYLAISQAVPGSSRARGISENGLITGWYFDGIEFVFKSFAISFSSDSGFEEIALADDEIVYQKPCDPNVPPSPGPGYDLFTDMTASHIRNDGVVVGQCTDEYFNETTGDSVRHSNGFIATPVQ